MAFDRPKAAGLRKDAEPGLFSVTARRERVSESWLTLFPRAGESIETLFERFAGAVRERDARVLKQTVLGSVACADAGRRALESACGAVDWPVTWVDGEPCDREGVAGVQAHLVSGVPVERVRLGGRPVGGVFDDGDARYCVLGDIRPEDVSVPRTAQARVVFERLEAALAEAGMKCTDVARTWLFLDCILDWYNDFNPVRTRFFSERNLFDALVPASTGIGAANPAGAAIAAEAIALQSPGGRVTVTELPSPLQCPARAYGSSFSRAVELATPATRQVLVSGTASIEPGGKTAHVGDTPAQIDLTMRVIEAILASQGMGFADVSRAIAYIKEPADAPLFARWCAERGLPDFPAIVAHDAICRDDLLFEMELDAIVEA